MGIIETAAVRVLMYLLFLNYGDLSVKVMAYCFILSLGRPFIGSK